MSGATNLILSVLALALSACGTTAVEPVAGGGVRGAFEGQLTVVVIDEEGSAIEGAEVWGGEGEEARILGVTDALGTLRIDEAVDVLTAVADGRAPASVAGADAAVVTLELASPAARPIVRVSVPGFDTIPLEDADYVRARGGFTIERGIESDEARQPASAIVECTRTGPAGACELELATRASSHRVFVAIARGTDAAGTPDDPSDDVLEPVALFLSDAITPGAASELDATVTELERADLTQVTVSPGAPPGGLDAVVGVPGAAVDEGVIVWPFDSPGLIPTRATHWAIGSAAGGTPVSASSVAIDRAEGTYDDGAELVVSTWRDPPAELSVAGGVVSARGVEQGDLVRVELRDSAGELAWSAHILDGREAIAPPAMLALPVTGAARVIVSEHAAQTEDELSFREVERGWTRRASRRASFTDCPFHACR